MVSPIAGGFNQVESMGQDCPRVSVTRTIPSHHILHIVSWATLDPMDRAAILASILWFAFASAPAVAQCIPFSEALQHVGETRCVKGKVLHVEQGKAGTTYLDFCLDYKQCTFTVVIFASNLRDVGDVRQLEGQEIEIHGPI